MDLGEIGIDGANWAGLCEDDNETSGSIRKDIFLKI
jgi:hypothetical protein